jgi:methyl-accepting chemotaxis protein
VVAGEVRALAQKSADAAKDIKHLINDSVTRIEAGTQLADKSGEMLSGVTGSIEQVAEMIEAIANASAEQSQGINQVHKAMGDIDRVTQENAALVEETTAAAESLSTEANHLKEPSMGLPSPSAKSNSNEWGSF